VEEAIKAAGRVPDIVYDLGEVGKEPMIRVLGNSAMDVVEKALASIRDVKKK
jgi:hydroxymethylpyrimidine/phosphomethylpyrimidine kinase